MSDFLKYRKIEILQELYEKAKEISISFGAPLSSFAETDKKLSEIKEAAKSKIIGGFGPKSIHNFDEIERLRTPSNITVEVAIERIKQSAEFGKYKSWNSEVGNEKAQEIMDNFHNGAFGAKTGIWVQVNEAIEYLENLRESEK